MDAIQWILSSSGQLSRAARRLNVYLPWEVAKLISHVTKDGYWALGMGDNEPINAWGWAGNVRAKCHGRELGRKNMSHYKVVQVLRQTSISNMLSYR